jgi:hypothetical protein
MYIDIITLWFNIYSVLTHEGYHEWTRRTRPLDMHVTDKELQHTDDFMFCAAPFHFSFVLEPKL